MSVDPRYPPWPEEEIKLDGGAWRLDPFRRIVHWVPAVRSEPIPDIDATSRGRTLKPCGTPAAYRRHLHRGEIACDDCVTAARDEKRRQRTRVAQRNAA